MARFLVIKLCLLFAEISICSSLLGQNASNDSSNRKPNITVGAGPVYTLSTDPNDIRFHLFHDVTNLSSNQEIVLNDTSSLYGTNFVRNQRTIIIVHGFRCSLESVSTQTLKDAFLTSPHIEKCNVIAIDWSLLSTPLPAYLTGSLYNQVTKNVPIVGQHIGEFILFLRRSNVISLADIHIVGHSLGAHAAGLAGRHVYLSSGERVSRITGLDPAGPNYLAPEPSRHLMKDNALFVDVIHTNAGLLGDSSNDGHIDFYPNGGRVQPGCMEQDKVSVNSMGRCSHWYAFQLFAESLSKTYPSCQCKNVLLSFPNGKCSSKCDEPVRLGYHCPNTASGEFYVDTNTAA